ncbi:hypothetical protein SCP_1401320 [Sparassis crispa]|uniref:F-box domain-containing protein n=1 Tax=Sparassis crispa TaxID=139825 RepID=A0A401H2R7_9APHY|nr:hypothetical protein SCP_1401320 [Sparassis crispa]GBE88727.1 hypothetical protein SCP_1401320 [Sparassis crispa]
MTLITPTLRSISLHVHDPNSIGGNLPTDLEQVAASLLLPISANTPSLRQLAVYGVRDPSWLTPVTAWNALQILELGTDHLNTPLLDYLCASGSLVDLTVGIYSLPENIASYRGFENLQKLTLYGKSKTIIQFSPSVTSSRLRYLTLMVGDFKDPESFEDCAPLLSLLSSRYPSLRNFELCLLKAVVTNSTTSACSIFEPLTSMCMLETICVYISRAYDMADGDFATLPAFWPALKEFVFLVTNGANPLSVQPRTLV